MQSGGRQENNCSSPSADDKFVPISSVRSRMCQRKMWLARGVARLELEGFGHCYEFSGAEIG
jgi:hypothetical protein